MVCVVSCKNSSVNGHFFVVVDDELNLCTEQIVFTECTELLMVTF